jgi:hypothetical protein
MGSGKNGKLPFKINIPILHHSIIPFAKQIDNSSIITINFNHFIISEMSDCVIQHLTGMIQRRSGNFFTSEHPGDLCDAFLLG